MTVLSKLRCTSCLGSIPIIAIHHHRVLILILLLTIIVVRLHLNKTVQTIFGFTKAIGLSLTPHTSVTVGLSVVAVHLLSVIRVCKLELPICIFICAARI